MTITLVFVTLIGLLVLGFSTPVALGASCLLYLFVLTDIASPTLQTGLLAAQIGNTLQSYVLPGIALFVLYGRLCAAMDIRGRFATSFAALFGGRRIAATIGEILASLDNVSEEEI